MIASPGRATVGAAFAGIAATLIVGWLVRPWEVGSVGFDSAASVLYFERISSGAKLEAFVGATPKPLLTVLYGIAFGLTHDWRAIGMLTVVGYGFAIGLATLLATRLAGAAAGAFACVALLGSALLLQDVALSYATPFALAMLAIAGLALTQRSPSYVLAGIALMVAALARFEVIVLPAVAAIAVVIRLIDRRNPGSAPRWSDLAPLLLGFLALPIMLVHDAALTGNAFYWLEVSARYSRENAASVRDLPAMIAAFVERYRAMLPMVILAALGLAWLIRKRSWPIASGLVAMIFGVAALLLLLAARNTYVSTRYFLLIDLALVFAASIGVAVLATTVRGRVRAIPDGFKSTVDAALVVVAVVIAFLVARPWAPTYGPSRRLIDATLQVAFNTDAAVGAIRTSLAAGECSDPASVRLVVPGLMTPRLAVDLDVPLDRIGPLVADPGGMPTGDLSAGSFVVHDAYLDRAQPSMPILESGAATEVDGVLRTPILADPGAGIWVVAVCPAGTP